MHHRLTQHRKHWYRFKLEFVASKILRFAEMVAGSTTAVGCKAFNKIAVLSDFLICQLRNQFVARHPGKRNTI
jgi:hypothetical protein